MKITNISCNQFAGIRDRCVSLTDGINVLYGKNESGKSTIVNLLSRTLFQNAKLDRRKDKEFFDLYFPAARKGNFATGDFADGKVTIETENGSFTISKEWSADYRCILSTPGGMIREQVNIDEFLKNALVYGEGVYTDMLFSSQRNTDVSLQTILDASKKTDAKQEIVNAVSQAFAESNGISADAIEQAITAKIEEIAGKHWDFARQIPVRKSGRWVNGLGEILKAYYALEDANAVLDEISRLESASDSAAADYTDKDSDVRIAEEAYNSFQTFAGRLAVQSERKKNIAGIEKELSKISEVFSNWPIISEKLEKAKNLKIEKSNSNILEIYRDAVKIRSEITENDLDAALAAYPDEATFSKIRTAHRTLSKLENKLCGMNLNAVINMLGEHTAEVTSLLTGKTIDVSCGITPITEAVKITVPGVMEMQLSPADVDSALVETQIAEQKQIINTVLNAYSASSLEELEALAKKVESAKLKIEKVNSRLAGILGSYSFEELKSIAGELPLNTRTKKEIEDDIFDICGADDVSRFITAKETIIEGYSTEYGSLQSLKLQLLDLQTKLKKAKETLAAIDDIPDEYLSISNPEEHLEFLKNSFKIKQNLRETALTAKTAAVSKLESYKQNISGSPAAEAEKAKRIFEETKSLLNHWLHIEKIFKEQKELLRSNPMQDIADRFTHYLGSISGGTISSEFPDGDKLNMHIYSDNRLLDFGKLSEGTKDTVSLAFRLAVLDHLFPEGGGVIVLDDPFTDMDADRTAQSCELIKECAARHQVIFLTCKKEYVDMLDGNKIFL